MLANAIGGWNARDENEDMLTLRACSPGELRASLRYSDGSLTSDMLILKPNLLAGSRSTGLEGDVSLMPGRH